MSWGGLNPALTAWRNGINALFPGRGTASDGGYADAAHGSNSQHQPDADGTVDAFDQDVNLLASGDPDGDSREDKLIEALKKDFEADRRAYLWIHQREIAEKKHGWSENHYSGENPHDKHVHWQSDPAYESDGSAWKFTHTEQVLEDNMTPEGAKMIADAIMASKIDVNGEPWRYDTGQGYRTRKSYEMDLNQEKIIAKLDELITATNEVKEAIGALGEGFGETRAR